MIESVESTEKLREKFRLWREFSTNHDRDSAFSLLTNTTKPTKMAMLYLGQKHILKSRILFFIVNHFEHLTSNGESLNYLKEPRTSEVTYFYLCDFVLGACVILAFFDF